MSLRFEGKVALVTGAASGIGACIAAKLIEEGARVFGLDINDELLQQRASELGQSFFPRHTDVLKESDVEGAVDATVSRLGRLDVAFNVAGNARVSNIVDTKESDWDWMINLCAQSVFFCIKHEARRMSAGSAIVNITSLNALVPGHGMAAYSAGKAAAEMLSHNAALELASRGIRVNSILPGLIQTPLSQGFAGIPLAFKAFMERIPLGRAGQPHEVAAPALFLASPEASYISGASLIVDGGWHTSGYPDLRPWLGLGPAD